MKLRLSRFTSAIIAGAILAAVAMCGTHLFLFTMKLVNHYYEQVVTVGSVMAFIWGFCIQWDSESWHG